MAIKRTKRNRSKGKTIESIHRDRLTTLQVHPELKDRLNHARIDQRMALRDFSSALLYWAIEEFEAGRIEIHPAKGASKRP